MFDLYARRVFCGLVFCALAGAVVGSTVTALLTLGGVND
ncbi:hypothetical protein BN1110_06321 [bacterium YEK0313]|nr:hypothetical protein BN1110_06321 [bacterium YEK0313]